MSVAGRLYSFNSLAHAEFTHLGNGNSVQETDFPEPEWRVYHWVSFIWKA